MPAPRSPGSGCHWGPCARCCDSAEGCDGCHIGVHAAGVRGVRFNFVKRLVDFTPKEELLEIAGRVAGLGWHVVICFEAVDLPDLWDFFTALPTVVVVDHMGRPDVTKPIDGPEFSLFERFMREHGNVGSKVTGPERRSVGGPPALTGETAAYRDVVPFAQRLVEGFPDRVLWGTDWPHRNLKDHMPDAALLARGVQRRSNGTSWTFPSSSNDWSPTIPTFPSPGSYQSPAPSAPDFPSSSSEGGFTSGEGF